MTRSFTFFCFLVVTLSVSLLNAQPDATDEAYVLDEVTQKAVDAVVSLVRPALVRIHAVTEYDDQGRKAKYESAGSGVIITAKGHVVTNHHVAGKATRIVCTLATKDEVEADLIGTDPLSDISVIKLRNPHNFSYPIAVFGNSDGLKVGDQVLAMGSPMALSQSVTMGIVSNTELVLPDIFGPVKFTLEGEDVGSIVRWIGHDAPIFPGNSGGPLVDIEGKIVGINEISLGISGAIPGNLAQTVALELISHGKIRRSWIGIEVQPLLKTSLVKEGVFISGTIEGSPAAQAGFLPGDVLVDFNGQHVNARFAEELPAFNQMIMNTPIGATVTAVVMRGGKKKVLSVTTREREYMRPYTIEMKEWGITLRDISYLMAKEMKREDNRGVLVTSVKPSGPAGSAKPGLEWNDIIVAVNDEPVNNIEDLLGITSHVVQDTENTVPVLVTFERSNDRYITVADIGTKETHEQGEEISKAWLGLALQVVTKEIAEMIGKPEITGIRVTRVFDHMPAQKAGILVGDIITAIDGHVIDASEPTDVDVLPAMIRRYEIGSDVALTVLRGTRELEIKVTLGSSPRPAREMMKYRDNNFEFTVRDIAFMDRVLELWSDQQQGVIVENVDTGSWAALANLLEGDLILEVDARPVKDVGEFKEIMSDICDTEPKAVVVKILRGIHTYFVEVEPDWQEKDSRE